MLVNGPTTGAPLRDLAVRVLEVELFGALSSPQALRVAVAEATRKGVDAGWWADLAADHGHRGGGARKRCRRGAGRFAVRRAAIRDTHQLGEVTAIHW